MPDQPTIPVPPAVHAVGRALAERGLDAVLVGGAVRDALRGAEAYDFDIVTNAGTDQLRSAAEGAPGVKSLYAVGERFGTLGLVLDGGAVVEASCYRPDALEADTVEARFGIDAGHRDLTINGIGFDLISGRLLDPLGGAADLRTGLLRAPGVPAERFAEDPLRVLRIARFASELGFAVDPATRAAMPDASPALAGVAPERVRDELTKLLMGEAAPAGLELLRATGALAHVLPEVAALDGVTQPSFHDLDVLAHTIQAVGLAPATPVMRWAALLHDSGKATARTIDPDGRIRFFQHAKLGATIAEKVCRRLRISNADTAAIVHLVAEHMRLGDTNLENPRSVDRAMRKLDLWVGAGDGARRVVSAEDAIALTLADFGATAHRDEAPALGEALEHAVAESRERGTRTQVVSPVSGDELMRIFGLAEGPEIGVAKDAIEQAIESGELAHDDREGALGIAREALDR